MTTTDTPATTAADPASAAKPGLQVVAALLRRDDQVLLVREVRDGEDIWSIPGGGVERQDGELLTEALVREVAEETGLRVLQAGPLAYLVNTTSAKYPSTMVAVFEVRDFDGAILVADPCEKVKHAEFLSADEACKVLESSLASRAETEPVIAYLRGASLGRVWSYRDNEPVN